MGLEQGVKVPRENLVGELNGGWQITMGSLAHERGGLWVEGVAGCLRVVDDIVALVRRRDLGRDAGITEGLGESGSDA